MKHRLQSCGGRAETLALGFLILTLLLTFSFFLPGFLGGGGSGTAAVAEVGTKEETERGKAPQTGGTAQQTEDVLVSAGTWEPPEPSSAAEVEELPEELVIQQILDGMTEREKIFQLFVLNYDVLIGVSGTTTADEAVRDRLAEYPVSGFVYQPENIVDQEQLSALVLAQQGYSKLPLLTFVDEEGGKVTRLQDITGSLNAMYSYKDAGEMTAYDNAVSVARNMTRLGLNTVGAPVADVWSNRANTVIGSRAYSDDFQEAAVLVRAAVEGFQDVGVICTLKHFPGHGDTYQDSHYWPAIVTKSREELEQQEFLPFQAGIDAGADMVMTGHLTAYALDASGTPATFSKAMVTEILRGELGFTGVVITDSLQMNAAKRTASGGEACVRALEAGCDLLLGPAGLPEELDACCEAVAEALDTGRLTAERLDESVRRVLRMKYRHGLFAEET